jgi:hypothetical protein
MTKSMSVIVPIKGNYEYIKSIILQSNKIKSDSFELVIQDNTEDNTEILKFLSDYPNPNHAYFHNPKPMNMVENFEEAIGNAKGEYVSIIGSDDNFSSKIVELSHYLSRNGIESAVCNKAIYYWPGMKFKAHHDRPNFSFKKGKGLIKQVNAQEELNRILKKGMVIIGDLPSPYHGIIKREMLEKVKEISGKYIPAACPDMAMAVSLAMIVNKHIYIDLPFIISGQSYQSAGGKGARGEHKGDLKNKSFLPENIEVHWPSYIPKIWTGPTVYADATHNTLININHEEKLNLFNKEANYAQIIAFFPEYKQLVMTFVGENLISKLKVYTYLVQLFIRRSTIFIRNAFVSKTKLTTRNIYNNINTSVLACDIVDEYVNKYLDVINVK